MPSIPDVCAFRPQMNPSQGMWTTGHQDLDSNAPAFRAGFFWLVPSLLFLFFMHSSFVVVQAQSTNATLSGTVMDQAGAVVPNVNITVISIAQGFERTAVTDDDGVFVVTALPPNIYIVKAEREGFSPAEQRNVILNVNSHVAIKMYLKVGDITQTVEVVDASSLLDTTPTVSTLVDRVFYQ
jgi:hypothetical protein